MKKNLLVLCLIALAQTNFVFAQQEASSSASSDLVAAGNNEFKINVLYGVLSIGELTYERVLGHNSGLGVSAAAGFNDDMTTYKFSVLPYYRMYFGKMQASGFYLEANAGLLAYEEEIEIYEPDGYNSFVYSRSQYVDSRSIGMGVAAGGKFLTRNRFFADAYFGVGRMFNAEIQEVYPRIGISLGLRF